MTPPNTDYAAMKFWVDIFVLVIVAFNTIYTWWSNREKVTSRRFVLLEKEVADRLKKIDLEEAKAARDKLCAEHKNQTKDLTVAYANLHIEVTRLPDRREISKLDATMKILAEKIGNLDGRMSGINRAVDLINEFLIEQGGKR